jgi:hypothetical protein
MESEGLTVIVGLAGYARSGKDEAAKGLTTLGFERRAFADKLREFIYRLNPVVTSPVWGEHLRLAEVIDVYGWDGYKESKYGKEIRELLQRLGTECGRQLISDTIWIDATLGDNRIMIPEPKIVVADVRFPNEFDAIVDRGGMMIRIHRAGVEAANDHISEHALDNYSDFYDADIINDGSINQLHDKVRSVVAMYF